MLREVGQRVELDGEFASNPLMRMDLYDIYQEREFILVAIKVGLILLGIKLGLILVGIKLN